MAVWNTINTDIVQKGVAEGLGISYMNVEDLLRKVAPIIQATT